MWILPKQLHASSGVSDTAGTISDSNELSQACAASLLVRSRHTQSRIWLRKLKQDCWTRFLSGRMLKPSHASSFETWWISSLQAIPASRSVHQANAKEKKTRGISGHLCGGQQRLFDPDLSSLKMWKATSASDCVKSLPNWLCSDTGWKTAVASQRGEYSRRLRRVRPRIAKGFSSSPKGKMNKAEWATICANKLNGSTREDFSVSLPEQVNLSNWKTPKADERGQYQRDRGTKGLERPNLTGQAKGLARPTPRASDGEKSGPNSRDGTGSLHLGSLAVQWSTPQASNAKGAPGSGTTARGGRQGDLVRDVLASARPTPSARDVKGTNSPEHMTRDRPHMGQLPNAVLYSGQDLSQNPDKTKTNGNRPAQSKLNADWVEALMDVPPMWTDCDYLETESIQQQPQKPSAS